MTLPSTRAVTVSSTGHASLLLVLHGASTGLSSRSQESIFPQLLCNLSTSITLWCIDDHRTIHHLRPGIGLPITSHAYGEMPLDKRRSTGWRGGTNTP